VRDGLTDRIEGLRSQRRSLRRRIAVEALIGVAVVAVAVVILLRVALPRWQAGPAPETPPVPATDTPAEQRPLAADAPVGETQTAAAPRRLGPATGSETQAAVAHRIGRVGDVVISVERAVVTRQVLTRFFGIPAHDPDPALEVHIRIANPGATAARYRTLRPSLAGGPHAQVVDDRGRVYPAIDFGAVPQGGVEDTPIEARGAVRDVLFFRPLPSDVRHFDLVIDGRSFDVTRDVTIRMPADAVEFESSGDEPVLTREPTPPRVPASAPERLPVEPPAPERIDPVAAAEHERLLAEADGGDAAACVAVGRNLERGEGTEPDPGRARAYYELAARQGDPEGQWNLGRALRDGIGGAPDAEAALRWFLKAAMRDHRQAQWDAAQMLKSGAGVRQDLHQAKRWLAKLVKAGHRDANFELLAIDPAAYADAAVRLRLRNTGPVNDPGSTVKFEGRLRDVDADRWTLVLDNGRTITVDLTRLSDPRIAQGIHVQACGILDADGSVEVLHGVVPEARCTVASVRVASPQGVVPYRQTRYVGEIAVRNVGVQPIRTLALAARVRVMSTTSQPQTGLLQNLAPGESGLIRLEFNLTNPGTVSPPVCEVISMDLNW
jgi:hypothetical protein